MKWKWSNYDQAEIPGKLHTSYRCADNGRVPLPSVVNVLEHPELGKYIIHHRTGERAIVPPMCAKC